MTKCPPLILKLWRATLSAITFSMVLSLEIGICPSTARSSRSTGMRIVMGLAGFLGWAIHPAFLATFLG